MIDATARTATFYGWTRQFLAAVAELAAIDGEPPMTSADVPGEEGQEIGWAIPGAYALPEPAQSARH